jgi:hypothetical protein
LDVLLVPLIFPDSKKITLCKAYKVAEGLL